MIPPMTKIIHQVWVGSLDNMPAEQVRFMEKWQELHPDFTHILWDGERAAAEFPMYSVLRKKCNNAAQDSDIIRFCALYFHGGLYLDTDFECVRPFHDLLDKGDSFFAGYEDLNHDIVATGLMYARDPRHPLLGEVIKALWLTNFSRWGNNEQTGPRMCTPIIERCAKNDDSVTLYSPEWFYPYAYGESRENWKEQATENTHAVHHWAASWC